MRLGRVAMAGLVVWVGLAGVGCAGAGAPAPAAGIVQAAQPSPAPPTATASGALSGVDERGGVAVLPFQEADAAVLHPGQPVRLTFPAVPGLTLPGRVHAIAPTAVSISGVANYWVTIALLAGDSRLRAGMSVTADVTVG
ncbi:hypothetical protein GCM10023321_36950 [Pseudonocardia eucalypti]|uniref:CusB-like beta-barrel domain-containing protein n=1 Tax=Pseudonocardia eucalypti TaxID=648755 RepID=A0ABP9Q926_9PSEU|nr:multidrug efflux pump subunit AcrA (membrane-fusion protein) [Pseudonocardia eucalypti]